MPVKPGLRTVPISFVCVFDESKLEFTTEERMP